MIRRASQAPAPCKGSAGQANGRRDPMSQRIFITGVTSYLGSAIATRLLRAGYKVDGLTRNTERVADLSTRGIRPVVGTLARPDTYLAALKNCDAAIHVA